MKKKITWLFKAFFIFTFSIILVELFLRLTEVSLPSSVYDDARFGRSHKANASIFKISSEGFCMNKVNEFGYLGTPYNQKRTPNSIRIALIGDSYIEGLQLFEKHHFRKKLEDQLSSITNKKVEVLNFGIGGIDFRGMYLLFREKISTFKPDYCLYFIKKNDLVQKDNLPVPEFYLDNDSLKLNYEFMNSEESKMRKKFAFIRNYAFGNLLKECYEYYHIGRTGDILFEKLNPFKSAPKKQNMKKSVSKDKDTSYKINSAILKQLGSLGNPHTAKSIIVISSELPEYYNELIIDYNLEVIKLNEELSKYGKEGRDLKYWKASKKYGHWNHNGHEVVANFLSTSLLNKYLKN